MKLCLVKVTAFVALLAMTFVGCEYRHHGLVLKGRSVYKTFHDKKVQQLALAAANGKVDEINELVKDGVNVNYQGNEGIAPLLWAFFANNVIGFEALLKNGANPNLMVGHDPMMRFFTEPIVMESNDDDEFKYDDAKFLELALKYRGDPNAVDSTDSTMLMIACAPGTMLRVELLLKYGADLEKKTPLRDETALLSAANINQYDKVYYLLQKGANYSIKNRFGYDLVRIIEEKPFGNVTMPITIGRKNTIQFLKERGYQFVPFEINIKNQALRG